ncbi:MAG: DUF434 domain-containing protein [Phycisphaeraceae bacterium]
MPDRRRHRGPHPEDRRLFAARSHPALRRAVAELSWLLGRGYAEPSSLKLVGDRYQLHARQRLAVMRSSCSDAQRLGRLARRVEPAAVAGRAILIDGYNVLTSLEAALAGGVLLRGRDRCVRDLASMHGSYRKVAETVPALAAAGEVLAELGGAGATWLLDRPVSNSGRLKKIIETVAADRGWAWQVEIVTDPDALLRRHDGLIATADGPVLDAGAAWVNLAPRVIAAMDAEPRWVDLDASA